jgi:hypothetical protein
MDWLLRPVVKNCIHYESLLDGTIGLYDIALLNDMLDVTIENQMLAEQAMEKNRRTK